MKYILFTSLEWLFKQLNMYAVVFLCHYLAGSGKKMYIPNQFIAQLNDEAIQDCWNEGGPSKWYNAPDDMYQKGKYNCLFPMIGKALLRKSACGLYAHLLDYYYFYPPCYSNRSHGRACDCNDVHKDWNHLKVGTLTLPNLIVKLPNCDIWSHPVFKFELWLNKQINKFMPLEIDFYNNMEGRWRIQACMSDRFWAEKGTPFYTVAHMKLEHAR